MIDTARTIAVFLRERQSRGELVSLRLARGMGVSPQLVSMIISGSRGFPLKYLDVAAAFFGFDDPCDFITFAREEVQRFGISLASLRSDATTLTSSLEILDARSRLLNGGDEDNEE